VLYSLIDEVLKFFERAYFISKGVDEKDTARAKKE
jgi:hypothetical protein